MKSDGLKEYKLGDICTKIGSGATPKGGKESYLEDGEFALVRSQNVLDFSFSYDGLAYINKQQASRLNNVALEEGDVLLNITGDSVARVCQVPNKILPARVNQHVAILRPHKEKVDNKYLKYYLLNPAFKNFMLGLSSVGGTRNALTKLMIEDFRLNLPEISIQKRVASILSSIDDKIELNRQTNQTLEIIAQAIFKEWFVDFRFPGATGEMQNSELGKIPKGWRVGKLSDIMNIQMGQSPPGSSYNQNKDGIVFFQGKAEFGFRFPVIDKYTTEPKRFANKFDTLLSVRAPVGTINMATEECCIGRGLAALRGKNNEISFTFYLLNSLQSQFDVFEGSGTVFGAINKSQLENLKVIVPPSKLIEFYEKKVNSIDDLLYNIEQEIKTLTQLRDSLLPKLMKGEMSI